MFLIKNVNILFFFKEFLTNSFFHDKIGEGAKNMLKKGMDIKLISELTNLTIEEIEKIEK